MNNGIFNGQNEFMQFLECLYANGQTLDENGNIVPIDNEKGKTLTLTIKIEDDDDE